MESREEMVNAQIVQRAAEKVLEIQARLCAAMVDLEARGLLANGSEAGLRLQEARSGLSILLKILRREVTTDPTFGLQKN